MTRLILGRLPPPPLHPFPGGISWKERRETIIIPAAFRVLCVSNGLLLPLNVGPHKNAFYVTRPRPLRVSPFSHRGANFFSLLLLPSSIHALLRS